MEILKNQGENSEIHFKFPSQYIIIWLINKDIFINTLTVEKKNNIKKNTFIYVEKCIINKVSTIVNSGKCNLTNKTYI